MSKLFCPFFLVGLFILFTANYAWSDSFELEFTASNFLPLPTTDLAEIPSPYDSISGSFRFEAESINAPIDSLTSLDLTIGHKAYSLQKVDHYNYYYGEGYGRNWIGDVTQGPPYAHFLGPGEDFSFRWIYDISNPDHIQYRLSYSTEDGGQFRAYDTDTFDVLSVTNLSNSTLASPVMSLSTDGLRVDVTWTEVAGATGYTLLYAPYPFAGPHTIVSKDMGTQTSLSLDFWDGAAYYFAVQALSATQVSEYSNIELSLIYAEGNAPKGMLSYSDTPTQDQEITLSFEVDKDLYETTWGISSKPSNSSMTLAVSADLKSATFTPDQIGEYEITVHSKPDGFEQATNFTIRPTFPYDESKIDGNDGETPLSEIIGVIKNQSWVYAPPLSETELRSIVSQYDEFKIVGYDEIQGLLIEYDEDSIQQTGALEAFRQESSISSVVNRVHEGENSRSTGTIQPNDGSSFYDGGDNWHLEFTDVLSAWDITTGNSDISVGVTDAGYDANHYELSGRISTLLSSNTHDHGNGVAGTIGALTDNGTGMSGINWTSQLLLGDWTYDHIISILNNSKLRLSNQSWIFKFASSPFDPNVAETVPWTQIKTMPPVDSPASFDGFQWAT